MFLSETRLTSNNASTYFSANKIPTPPMPLSFPTQNILYWDSFLQPTQQMHLYLNSCKPQMSILRLDITSTISFEQPLTVPTF